MTTTTPPAGTTNPFRDTEANLYGATGLDLVMRQKYLRTEMEKIEQKIADIEQNSNLSDTEKMFSMQMAMNSWSAISNLRTNMLKTVADTIKSIARNVS
ncbi:EscF/YscF/HrpA family type III secretion system needle major subunit [Chthonobacter rhizosphaerae]|uniref:EscF/YscF/HrpA family type III secretion system needle major subunit n=1 Tax=Chthonobacter rhizosphaerae TaxID=2735553 RepID=UPI0015EF08AD|nr:EscF/YscF/HrpA family type III secretion system needle major subunit [Chthonobacter rhizosphaerae]